MRRRALLRAGSAAIASVPAIAATRARARAATARTQSDQSAYEPLGRIDIEDAAEVVVGDDGDTAYVATTTGFATVDISDPADPEIRFETRDIGFDGAPMNEILDVTVDGDRLAIAGPANPRSDAFFHGFACYDVSDPAEPELIGEPYETGYHIHNCYLEDDLLYVAANDETANPLAIYDVGGDETEEIGRWSLLDREPGWRDVDWLVRYLHDVYVQDEIAYLAHWDAGTYLLDVSDPSSPEYISHVSETTLEDQQAVDDDQDAQFGLPGNDHYAAVDDAGDLLAVGREAWATGGDDPDRPGGIDLYDISDPSEPAFQASIEAPRAVNERYDGRLWTTSHNFELRDGDLYSAWYQGGVKIHDVSDPAEPEELASWRDPETAGFWTARVVEPGETVVASSTPLIPGAPTDGALYTFPIEAGEQADPPSLTDSDALEFTEEPDADDEAADDESGADSETNSSSDTDDGAGADSESETESDSESESIPGFTAPGAGLGVASVAALEALRRRLDDETE